MLKQPSRRGLFFGFTPSWGSPLRGVAEDCNVQIRCPADLCWGKKRDEKKPLARTWPLHSTAKNLIQAGLLPKQVRALTRPPVIRKSRSFPLGQPLSLRRLDAGMGVLLKNSIDSYFDTRYGYHTLWYPRR